MRSVLLIAASSDYESLLEYCVELQLRLVPMQLGGPVLTPEEAPGCFLSPLPESELHPYGVPPIRLSSVTDPLLLFMRPYFSAPFLTDGGIYLDEDNEAVSAVIRPSFEKIRRWLKKHWEQEKRSYIGPEAQRLLKSGQAQWRSQLHAAVGHVVIIK